MQYQGQAHQDEFVVEMSNHKRGGSFLELGANDSRYHNNTFVLETELGWKGIMIEYDGMYLPSYQRDRQHSIHVINDATQVDYVKLLTDHQFPKHIDYLQVDLDVDNRSTLTTLEKLDATIFDQYTFGLITFEHDIYTGNFFDTKKRSHEILEGRGYVRVFENISVWWNNKWSAFEDWYAHPVIINSDLIESIISDESNIEGLAWPQVMELLRSHTYQMYH